MASTWPNMAVHVMKIMVVTVVVVVAVVAVSLCQLGPRCPHQSTPVLWQRSALLQRFLLHPPLQEWATVMPMILPRTLQEMQLPQLPLMGLAAQLVA